MAIIHDRQMRIRKDNLVQIYVWQIPIRFFHWLNALCIVILCITGVIIGNPPAIMTESNANEIYWFGTVRFIHFVTAFVFVCNYAMRVYWGFAGNRFARWQNFVELKKSDWVEIFRIVRGEIFLQKTRPFNNIGHNRLAAFTYTGLFVLFLIQVITGFGIYSRMSEAYFPQLFGWVLPLIGGTSTARMIHHFLMWLFIIFAMIHIYLVWYTDYVDHRSETSAMIGGWKLVDADIAHEEVIKERAELIDKSARHHEPEQKLE